MTVNSPEPGNEPPANQPPPKPGPPAVHVIPPPSGNPSGDGKPLTLEEQLAAAIEESNKWKAHSRKNETAAKKLQAIEDAQKSELEKAQTRLAELEAENKAHSFALLQTKVGNAAGLPAWAHDRLRGNDEAELTADAAKVKEQLGVQGSTPGGGSRPQENLNNLLQNPQQQNSNSMPDMDAFMRGRVNKAVN